MPKLSDLGLGNEKVGEDIDYATIPEQMGGFAPPPQPGGYRFQVPTDMSQLWETFDYTGGKNPGKRLRAKFDDSFPLQIVQSPAKAYDGEPFQTSISNAERKRGKKDDATAPEVSDMDYLLRDGFGVTAKPKTNMAYAQELTKQAGQVFGADVEWSWRCRDDKDIRVAAETGGTTVVEGQKGCGARYYQKDITKVHANPDDPNSPLVFPEHITCQCGADLRAYANLTRFRR